MSKYAFAAAAALSALIASSAAMADSIPSPAITVQVVISAGCNIVSNGGNVTFAPSASSATKPGAVITTAKVSCSAGEKYDVTVSSGNMTHSSGTGTIGYTATVTGGAVTAANNDGAEKDFSISYAITAADWKAGNKAGTYTGTSTLTVAF